MQSGAKNNLCCNINVNHLGLGGSLPSPSPQPRVPLETQVQRLHENVL